ncbi:MAG: M48 family metallopeptidase [Thiohalocapsa sp.]|jgi:predicted Zn-dependent protease|uniref:M48 family metallopeptidase n=1 Tax=Thiohalocapsa sp. TaxID=2497641 RepID=UPI0025CC6E6D|nr:M48 family metallopeptidase [Thiohalocapsa sp.]MCG6941620.1 M48 family metallopeptidase [Thiohalocapsa sp.]
MSTAYPALVLTAGLFGSGLIGSIFGGGHGGDDCHRSAAGARTMEIITKEWPLRLAADPVRDYVRVLGERLASTADPSRSGAEWRFFVVRNLEPTAFAVGGRRFVISDGLIAFVRSESDLAAVLAHEMAHEHLGHFCKPEPRDSARFQYGSIVQHFNIDMEEAADAEAVVLLGMAGFDPASMYHLLRCLSERPGAPTEQLRQRMRALQYLTTESPDSTVQEGSELKQIRSLILQDFGGSISRCR